jgi:hypothetical protein
MFFEGAKEIPSPGWERCARSGQREFLEDSEAGLGPFAPPKANWTRILSIGIWVEGVLLSVVFVVGGGCVF